MEKKITALELQSRNRNRVNVSLDGEFAFGLARIVAGWLHVGQMLSPEKIAALREEDAREVAFQRAVKFLGYRPRSENEIRQHLQKHATPEPILAATLDKLRTNGLLDDQQFANAWVENRNTFRPRGARALRMELKQKGLADRAIAQALEGLDEFPLALQAAEKQAAKLRGLDETARKQKLYGFLARRGFSYETIAEAVQKVLESPSS